MRLILFKCIHSHLTGLRMSTWVRHEHLKWRLLAYLDIDLSVTGQIHRFSFLNLLAVQFTQKRLLSWLWVPYKQYDILVAGIDVNHGARSEEIFFSSGAFQKLHSWSPLIKDRWVSLMDSTGRQLINFCREFGLILSRGLTRDVGLFLIFCWLVIDVDWTIGGHLRFFSGVHGVGIVVDI